MKKTLGSVFGGVGLLLLLFTAPISFITFESLTPFVVTLSLGAAGVVTWLVTRGAAAREATRSAFFYGSSVATVMGVVALLIAVNVIAARRAPSFDLTARKLYSLSAQTQTTLKELKHDVKVLAFAEGALPTYAESLLDRYAQTNARFTWERRDPRTSPDLAARYRLTVKQPAAVLSFQEGAEESHVVVNLNRLADPTKGEQELTNGLLKLEQVGAQKLYFVKGHGEIPLQPVGPGAEAEEASLSKVARVLQDEGYAPEGLNLIEQTEVPSDASALVIAGARSPFAPKEVELLERYLEAGGRLLYFGEAGSEPKLGELLSKYGAQIEPGLVADAKVNPDQPFIVYTPFLNQHEITRALLAQQANLVFPTTRGITRLATDTLPDLTITPLVTTTPYAWVELEPSEHPTRDPEERAGQIILAMAVTRPASAATKRSNETKVVIFGDSDLLTGVFGYDADRNLVLNAIAWSTQQIQRITIRPPDRDLSTLDLTPDRLQAIRLVAIDLFPTLLLAVGLTIWLTRRSR